MRKIDDPDFKQALHSLLGLTNDDTITAVIPTRVKVIVKSDHGTFGSAWGQIQNISHDVYDVELSRRDKQS